MKEEQRKKTGKRIYKVNQINTNKNRNLKFVFFYMNIIKAVSILDLDGIGMGHTSSKVCFSFVFFEYFPTF